MSAQPLQTVRQIQERLDWERLEAHLGQLERNDPGATESVSASSGSNRGTTQRGMDSSSTRHLDYELLDSKFQKAHAEVGCRARELRHMLLSVGLLEDDAQPELPRICAQVVKDAVEFFSALADKMSRLKTKLDLSRPVVRRLARRSEGEALGAQTARSHGQSTSTRQSRSSHPRAGDGISSDRSHNYQVSSVRQPRTNSRVKDNNQPLSVMSAPSWQGRPRQSVVPRDAPLHGRHSDPFPAASEERVNSQMSFDSEQGSVPPAENSDDLADLIGMPRTFTDLSQLHMEDTNPFPA